MNWTDYILPAVGIAVVLLIMLHGWVSMRPRDPEVEIQEPGLRVTWLVRVTVWLRELFTGEWRNAKTQGQNTQRRDTSLVKPKRDGLRGGIAGSNPSSPNLSLEAAKRIRDSGRFAIRQIESGHRSEAAFMDVLAYAKQLEGANARFVLNHINNICEACGHTKTEDGCAHCLRLESLCPACGGDCQPVDFDSPSHGSKGRESEPEKAVGRAAHADCKSGLSAQTTPVHSVKPVRAVAHGPISPRDGSAPVRVTATGTFDPIRLDQGNKTAALMPMRKAD